MELIAKSNGQETKEPIIWKEKEFNMFAINTILNQKSTNLFVSIHFNLTISS